MPPKRGKRAAPKSAVAEAPAAKKAVPAKKDEVKEAEAEAKKAEDIVESSNGADASAPEGQGGIVVTIEHCKSWQVYKKKANEIVDFLQKEFPEATFKLNPDKPRSKAFNISVTKPGKDEKEEVWDGRTKGPPRKDKFPELDDVLAMVKKALE